MGIRFKQPSDAVASASTASISPSLRELLLLTTMSIIGLPVEVHIKDGSVYSGIFHTASVEEGYGVVLKKARMIKMGTHTANGLDRSLIEILVVLPQDLVQVLAKSVKISADGVSGGVGSHDVGAITKGVKSFEGSEKEPSSAESQSDGQTKNSVRQDGAYRTQEEGICDDKAGFHKEEHVHELQAPSTSSEGCHLQVKTRKESDRVISKQQPNGTPGKNASQDSPDSLCQSKTDSNPVNTPAGGRPDKSFFPSAMTTRMVPAQDPVAIKSAKESKLNPGAKIFSPSFANVRSVAAPPVLTAGANVAYVPNYFPAVPLVAPQPELGIRSFPPCPSVPLKFVSYGNLATANGGNGLQYAQPIAGPIPSTPPPVRYSGHYQPIQPGPPYAQPISQNGLVGRTGQLVYLGPATHEMVPGALPFSHAPYPQLTSHAVHIAKHEGVMGAPPPQLSATPPLMANDQLPFAVPSHIPLTQPTFPPVCPVPVLGASGPYDAKFV